MMFITSLICLVTLVMMLARIWKNSALLSVASFLFWPALLFALFKYWGDEESDIKGPFLVFLPCSLYTLWEMKQWSKELEEVTDGMLWAVQVFA